MNWYLIKKAKLDENVLNEESQPFLDSGLIEEADRRFEKHWYEIVGTNYEVYAEEDADPYREGMYEWAVLDVPNNTIIDYGGLGELLKKYAPSKAQQAPQPVEDVNFVLSKLYDIKNRNDPRAAPWLEKYRNLTGRPFPKFMA